jgi:hypothetical protein
VRLLLDAHLSHRSVARPLREPGHDALALQEHPTLAVLSDSDVLALGVTEERILVTCNAKHFDPLARDWSELGRDHAGIVLIWTLRTHEHESIVAGVADLLEGTPSEADWRNLVLAV